ncbi:MBL fold metallo-hydrolase [Bradyrhizobium guangdongense]|uniref:MBL fold metallo-hydrolase n=1 Tax=Bradyrhizobium guangdongense TaxID=1325090 RepID=UPI0011271939|nr:MBL fold metallo-hydrolase [Bradyrhizobium guangdongense]TPQ32478.1 MBL fold metallo-hydrolase [Bradyrhizobium guangdongense]
MRFPLGEAIVDIIVDDDDFSMPVSDFFPDRDPELIKKHRGVLEPDFLDLATGMARFAIQSFVLRTATMTILIDSCLGEGKDRPEIPVWHQRRGSGFLDRLRRAGVDPASIDLVFCTHLHIDHVGWNTQSENGRWVPSFPNARYLFGRNELNDWLDQLRTGRALPLHARGLEDSVIPIVEAGRADLVDDGYELGPGLRLLPLPGHTRGQMGVAVDFAQARALFCGDAVHNPLQIYQPGLSTGTCVDPKVGGETRHKIFAEAADNGRLLVPAHFRGQRCAHIHAAGDSYEPVFDVRPGES